MPQNRQAPIDYQPVSLAEAVARAGGETAWEQLDRADRSWVRNTGTTPPGRDALAVAMSNVAKNGSPQCEGEVLALAYSDWRSSSAEQSIVANQAVGVVPEPADRFSSDDVLKQYADSVEQGYDRTIQRMRKDGKELIAAADNALNRNKRGVFGLGAARDATERWLSSEMKIAQKGGPVALLEESQRQAKTVLNAMKDVPPPGRDAGFGAADVSAFARAVEYEFKVRAFSQDDVMARTVRGVEKGIRVAAERINADPDELLVNRDATVRRVIDMATDDAVRTAARQWHDASSSPNKVGAFSVHTTSFGAGGDRVPLASTWRAVGAIALAEASGGLTPDVGEVGGAARTVVPPMFVGPLHPSQVRQIGEVALNLERRLEALPNPRLTLADGEDGPQSSFRLEDKVALMQDPTLRAVISQQLDEAAKDLGAEQAVGLLRAEIGYALGNDPIETLSGSPNVEVRDDLMQQAKSMVAQSTGQAAAVDSREPSQNAMTF